MCLDIKRFTKETKIAKTDIVCYKAVRMPYYGLDMVTFYRKDNVKLGETYRSNLCISGIVYSRVDTIILLILQKL